MYSMVPHIATWHFRPINNKSQYTKQTHKLRMVQLNCNMIANGGNESGFADESNEELEEFFFYENHKVNNTYARTPPKTNVSS